jgi:hypothetical protein
VGSLGQREEGLARAGAEERGGSGSVHAGEKKEGGAGRGNWATVAQAGGERERGVGRLRKEREGEGFGPAGWAPFYSFSFSILH